ncbi:hypothetical protein [Haloferula sargassicola]|uniref:hypothetical protein n=1 Tax=Haloferula sargassicola TaxID=490096 RepID=UPI0033656FB0
MKTNSDTTRTLYLGRDVHKEQTVIAILEASREAGPRLYGSVTTSPHALERALRRIAKQQGRKLSDLHVCYEASGCGFWIARRLRQMGVRCEVIAPSLIPTRSGDRVKTDKRDAQTRIETARAIATPPAQPAWARSTTDNFGATARSYLRGSPCLIRSHGEALPALETCVHIHRSTPTAATVDPMQSNDRRGRAKFAEHSVPRE